MKNNPAGSATASRQGFGFVELGDSRHSCYSVNYRLTKVQNLFRRTVNQFIFICYTVIRICAHSIHTRSRHSTVHSHLPKRCHTPRGPCAASHHITLGLGTQLRLGEPRRRRVRRELQGDLLLCHGLLPLRPPAGVGVGRHCRRLSPMTSRPPLRAASGGR